VQNEEMMEDMHADFMESERSGAAISLANASADGTQDRLEESVLGEVIEAGCRRSGSIERIDRRRIGKDVGRKISAEKD
jgi:hypothetical protein